MRNITLLLLSLSIGCTSAKDDTSSTEPSSEDSDTDVDTDDTDIAPPPSYFEPTSLVFSFESPYANNEVSTVNFGGTVLGGTFTVIMADSANLTTTYYDPTYSCWLTFEFDNTMVVDDTTSAMTDDGEAFADAGGWLAWTIDATAYVGKNGACDNVDPLGNWPATIASYESGTYGFGFGALTQDLSDSIEEYADTPEDWIADSPFYLTGYVGTNVIDGAYKYYDTNRAVAWDITSGDLEVDADGLVSNPKYDFSDALFMIDNGYYSANPWFGWSFTN